MECKNIECKNETIGKRVYCSLSCRNIFVNKYLRNYDKVSSTFKKKKEERENKYLINPKKCEYCNEIIIYDKILDNQKFCSQTCSASFTNRLRKGIKYTLSDEGRESLVKSAWKNLLSDESRKKSHESQNRKGKEKVNIICINCDKLHTNKKYCSINCTKEFKRKDMDEYQKYRLDSNFKFNLADYPNEFDFSLIEKYGWYSPTNKNNNLGGISRDHMLSVREGFEMKIDPIIISHPANCKLMIHNENISKNKKSTITNDELLERIKEFENKYLIQ